MSLGPSSLLDGPRGRRLCLEVLLDEARRSDTAEARDAVHAVFWAAYALAENPGTLIHIGGGAQPFVEPDVSPAEAAAALEGLPVPEITADGLARALSVAVDLAAYWQPPSGEDALAATPEVRRVLARVADAVALSAHAAWWESPVVSEDQAAVAWDDETFALDDPGDVLSRWRAAMADDELQFAAYTNVSGPWWSTPPFALTRTTRVREPGGALGLSRRGFAGMDVGSHTTCHAARGAGRRDRRPRRLGGAVPPASARRHRVATHRVGVDHGPRWRLGRPGLGGGRARGRRCAPHCGRVPDVRGTRHRPRRRRSEHGRGLGSGRDVLVPGAERDGGP